MLHLSDEIKKKADLIDDKIIEVLKSGQSFIVEAGAGSGKTYSLLKAIDWLEINKCSEYRTKKKNIACITYTNAAVNVIFERLSPDSSIIPSTIHSFAWKSMNQYQQPLIQYVEELELLPEDITIDQVKKVDYRLGSKYFENGTLYLYHNDVTELFSRFLDNEKFRRLLSLHFPIILIDEYQDSFKKIIDKFIENFVEGSKSIQFCFFGDSWQTIYTSSGACGKIESSSLIEIRKNINFRSRKAIVDMLNRIRPDLPQISANEKNDGKVVVITTDDYAGIRQTKYYSGELQQDDLVDYIDKVKAKLESCWDGQVKTLMISHKMLANQQKYSNILEILGDSLKDNSDNYVQFFQNVVEPLYAALCANNINALYDVVKQFRSPIETKKQKIKWHNLKERLSQARKHRISDVISVCITYANIIPIPPVIIENDNNLKSDPNYKYQEGTLGDLYNASYSEIINAIGFISPESDFSTEHGVKGEEYENVLFIIGRGWNNYKFDEQVYLNPDILNGKIYDNYIRNRNLFYVCCSRPEKRLALFITVPINQKFRLYLEKLVGSENICTFNEFIQQES